MLREQILSLVKQYVDEQMSPGTFDSQTGRVNYAGRVYDADEVVNLVDSALEFWLTEGRYARQFEQKIAQFLRVDHVLLTNSGSSSNLLAVSALTSKKLKDRRLKPGDEVITVAAGFPTTITPIVQNRLVPVFVDISLPTYNIDINQLEQALSPKSKALMVAHTLGNPFDLAAVTDFCRQHNLWLIEDNADAFGSRYDQAYTGSFGDLATFSFYPAHHITTGEGGAVVTRDDTLAKLVTSFRDWGRDCHCKTGVNNHCGKRFSQKFGTLPLGYDHKYVYSEIGYNLKMTDMQAAIGVAQMDKLPRFSEKRRENFQRYQEIFSAWQQWFILPEATPRSEPSWFGYVISVRDDAPFTRHDIVGHLDSHRIDTRNVFAGNMTRQPAFLNIPHRNLDDLPVSDFVMNNSFFLGTYPGITTEIMAYIKTVVDEFSRGVEARKKRA